MRLLPYGEHAVLAELDDPHQAPALQAALAALDGVIEAVAGAGTVLAVYAPGAEQRVRALLSRPPDAGAATALPAGTERLAVHYDGADLDAVADESGLTVDDVIRLHCGAEYTVRFCGFSPGFAYLDGLDPRLRAARRPEPRTRVPAGSVAIAGEFAGVYPRESPGGWRLLGHTDAPLWDIRADPPALLTPGTRVRFEPA